MVYTSGRFAVAGTDLGIDLAELAARQPQRRIAIVKNPSGAAATAGHLGGQLANAAESIGEFFAALTGGSR